MTRVILNGAAIVFLNAAAALLYLHVLDPDEPAPPWETSSVLQIMPRKTHTDIVLLGTSHARSMTGCPESAAAFTHSLDASVINLAKNTAGPSPLRLYLEEFYGRGNSADVMIYFADPWVFYTMKWNEEHGFLLDEPLDPHFLARCIAAKRSPKQVFQNARKGFTKRKYTEHLLEMNACDGSLPYADSDFIRHRVNHLYAGPPSNDALNRYVRELERICTAAVTNGSRIVIATPPTLLGPLPGMDAFTRAMEMTATKFGGRYHNFADAMNDFDHFVDHDHLNARGVGYFAEHYLAPAIADSGPRDRIVRAVAVPSQPLR